MAGEREATGELADDEPAPFELVVLAQTLVLSHDGYEATIWLGRPLESAAQSAIVSRMTAAVAAEYDAVAAEAAGVRTADTTAQRRAATRLRRELPSRNSSVSVSRRPI